MLPFGEKRLSPSSEVSETGLYFRQAESGHILYHRKDGESVSFSTQYQEMPYSDKSPVKKIPFISVGLSGCGFFIMTTESYIGVAHCCYAFQGNYCPIKNLLASFIELGLNEDESIAIAYFNMGDKEVESLIESGGGLTMAILNYVVWNVLRVREALLRSKFIRMTVEYQLNIVLKNALKEFIFNPMTQIALL